MTQPSDVSRNLPMASNDTGPAESPADPGAPVTGTYAVDGMTCGHCAHAVTQELSAVAGVRDVQVGLVAGGTSTVTVVSDAPLDEAAVTAALEEAGDYTLV